MLKREDIFRDLENMGAQRSGVVLMHTAYRTVGEVEGGASGFLDALIEYFTYDGGLFCLPAHTWMNFGKPITLDMTSPESNLGILPVIAAKDKRGIRTENPTHSIIVFGDRDRALDFAKDERWIDNPTAKNSCYGKLYDLDGSILLVGVDQTKNTYIHAVEEMLGAKNRLTDEYYSFGVKRVSGEIYDHKMRWLDERAYGDVSHRFSKFALPFRYHKVTEYGFLGNAPTELCSARGIYRVLEKNI